MHYFWISIFAFQIIFDLYIYLSKLMLINKNRIVISNSSYSFLISRFKHIASIA
jgi:hypothetical protein